MKIQRIVYAHDNCIWVKIDDHYHLISALSKQLSSRSSNVDEHYDGFKDMDIQEGLVKIHELWGGWPELNI